jgi:hypothetical protein
VYRVGGKIPIGYRVGGTAIAALALIEAPGYGEDAGRREAVARAVDFIIKAAEDPLMLPDYDGGYDVRGWGYTYGLALFLRLKALNAFPAGREDAADGLIRQNINAIQLTAIREVGGWNYARPVGRELVAPPSTFMTAPTVLALLDAKAAGYAVDEETLGRAVESLERARTPVGGVVYSGAAEKRQREAVPGAVGRMLVTEVTLMKVGRSDLVRVRGALDAFFTHWSWLDQRRAKPGTHVGPYAIAPYYFYYAHRYAAQAIEMLPKTERNEYRRRLHELLFSVRLEDGSWNDRVFPRSAAYGTSMVMLALIDMQGAEENPK